MADFFLDFLYESNQKFITEFEITLKTQVFLNKLRK